MPSRNYQIGNYWYREFQGEDLIDFMDAQQSGLIEVLSNRKLIPHFELLFTESNVETLTLKVPHIYSPAIHEWTLPMYCEAALLHLEIVEISGDHGFTLIDAHFANVLFKYGKPRFIDFGSLKKSKTNRYWQASREYVTEIGRPIRLIERGYSPFVRGSLERGSVSRDLLWRLSHPIVFRMLRPLGVSSTIVKYRERLALIGVHNFLQAVLTYSLSSQVDRNFESIIQYRVPKLARYLDRFRFIMPRVLQISCSLLALNLKKEKLKLEEIQQRLSSGYWTEYYKDSLVDGDIDLREQRFRVHLECLKDLKVVSVTDIGGNDGTFILWLLEQGIIESGIVLDSDEVSLERGRRFTTKRNLPVSFGLVDITSQPAPDRVDATRYSSDLVCALGLFHHLCLRFRLSFEHALRNILAIPSAFLMVEFMPRGLVKGSEENILPDWYNLQNFEQSLKNFVTIISRVEADSSRVLYVCKRNDANRAQRSDPPH
jgi:hypothetical protein